MRKILASFLMLVMFAAPLVCGCGHESLAASHVDSDHHSDSDHHHDKGSTLAQDCQKADMQLPQQASVSKPDLKNSLHLDYAWNDDQPVSMPVLADGSSIRAPPLWYDPPAATLPIFLTTQRLRI